MVGKGDAVSHHKTDRPARMQPLCQATQMKTATMPRPDREARRLTIGPPARAAIGDPRPEPAATEEVRSVEEVVDLEQNQEAK